MPGAEEPREEAVRPLYHRVLLKLSGDAIAPLDTGYGISTKQTGMLASEIADVVDLGVQCAVVVGVATSSADGRRRKWTVRARITRGCSRPS